MEKDDQFKVPVDEPQPVDNFSAPENKEVKPPSPLTMPPKAEPKAPEPANPESIKTESEGEIEDVFAGQEKTPQPSGDDGQEVHKLDFPQEKKSGRCCCLSIVAILILLILAALAVFINEWGILDLGIEKYYGAVRLERIWRGLPSDSKAALFDSLAKMKGKSFVLEGTSDSSLWGEEFSAEGEVKIEAKIQNKDKFEVNLEGDLSSDLELINNLLAGNSAVALSAIYDSGTLYLKNEALKNVLGLNQEWLKIKPISSGKAEDQASYKLADLASGGERTGSEKVGDTSCYVYELKINNQAFEGYLRQNHVLFSWLSGDSSYQSAKFYLGKRDHLIHKVELTASNEFENTSLNNKLILNFKNIGSSITITAPESDQVAEKISTEVKNAVLGYQDTAEKRDLRRKADLKIIQSALSSYKVENGKYPSTNNVAEKTRDSSSALKSALVPKYLAALPLDPMTTKYYYGYKSADGLSYELTSILEVTSDPEGEQIGNYFIYKLIGN